MARSRTTKTIAKRIDLGYFKRPHPMRTWRRILTWAVGAIALVWVLGASFRTAGGKLGWSDAISNPAPVTPAHGMLQNDCVQCHTPAEGKSFSLSVTDESCLKCHDGPIHHPNAKMAAEAALVSRKLQILAIKDAKRPGEGRAAACATCHVEHRGREALGAVSDAHCIVCHADLSGASTTPAKAPNRTITFDTSNHPAFGRKLRDSAGAWADPTVVRFNHKYHLEKVDEIRNHPNSCATCHAPSNLDRRYLQPVSYAKHCQSCHELRPVPDAAPVAHEDLAIVRAQLASPAGLFTGALRKMTPEQREAALTKKVQRGRTTTTVKLSEADWAADKLKALSDAASSWFDSNDAAKLPNYEVLKSATTQPADGINAAGAVMEYYVAAGMGQSCAKCHDLKPGDVTGELATVATGIGSSPRRWFTGSIFDHDAHRDQSCKDCHFAAWTSEKTSDVLMPDIDKANPGAMTCVQCHVPSPARGTRAAPASCVTCHVFHDRHYERPTLVTSKN